MTTRHPSPRRALDLDPRGALSLMLLLHACSPVDAPRSDDDAVAVTDALVGRTQGEQCTPFMLAHFDAAQTLATALLDTPAFRACVADRVEESYLDCADDAAFPVDTPAARSVAAASLLEALSVGTHITLSCSNREGGACGAGGACPAGTTCLDGYCAGMQDWAGVGRYEQHQSTLINISGFWTRQNWDGNIVPTRATNPAYPWDAVADTVLHEFSHTQGYVHVRDEACAQRLRGRAYYAMGEPSAPYILGECASAAVQAMFRDGRDVWSCGPDAVALPATYNPTLNDPLDSASTLVDGFAGVRCSSSLRHRASLVAADGRYVQAFDDGGSTVSVASPGPGQWETFHLVDRNRGALVSGDLVNVRAGSGHLLRAGLSVGAAVTADGTDDDESRAIFRVRRSGGGTIRPNDTVWLESLSRGRFVTASSSGQLLSDATVVGTAERFRLELPRRAQLVSLRTADGLVAAFVPGTTELRTRSASGPGQPAAREEAFWLHDHGGGELRDGDVISLESSHVQTYVATCRSGLGAVRGDHWWATGNSAGGCARLRVVRVAGPGRVVHGDQIRLISAEGRYLEALPATHADVALRQRLVNRSTTATPSGVFTVELAQGARFDVR